jgi:hypothetical protein
MGRRLAPLALVPFLALTAGCGGSSTTNVANAAGHWTRNVTLADWSRYDGTSFPSGVWGLTIEKTGAVGVYIPGKSTSPDFTTRFSDQPGEQFVVDTVPVCGTKGRYRWKLSGSKLTITVVADKGCGPREALFVGTWEKK